MASPGKAGTSKGTKAGSRPGGGAGSEGDAIEVSRIAQGFNDPYSEQARASAFNRATQIEAAAEKLENGRFKILPSDSDRVRLGKDTAMDAFRDAKNPGVGLLAAKNKKGEPVGFMSIKTGRSNYEIVHIGTDQTQKGTGRALFNQAVKVAAKGNKGLTVSAIDDAVPFYKKMGMKDMGSGSDFSLSAADVKRMAASLR